MLTSYWEYQSMDIISLAFYGIICGVLSFLSPAMTNKILRLAIGVGVGLLAAAVLPIIRGSGYVF